MGWGEKRIPEGGNEDRNRLHPWVGIVDSGVRAFPGVELVVEGPDIVDAIRPDESGANITPGAEDKGGDEADV